MWVMTGAEPNESLLILFKFGKASLENVLIAQTDLASDKSDSPIFMGACFQLIQISALVGDSLFANSATTASLAAYCFPALS